MIKSWLHGSANLETDKSNLNDFWYLNFDPYLHSSNSAGNGLDRARVLTKTFCRLLITSDCRSLQKAGCITMGKDGKRGSEVSSGIRFWSQLQLPNSNLILRSWLRWSRTCSTHAHGQYSRSMSNSFLSKDMVTLNHYLNLSWILEANKNTQFVAKNTAIDNVRVSFIGLIYCPFWSSLKREAREEAFRFIVWVNYDT